MSQWARVVALLAGCSGPTAGGAHITSDDLDLTLPHLEVGVSEGRSLMTWSLGVDAGVGAPFFQIRGIPVVEGTHDPLFDEFAFAWPGVHDRPWLHSCKCEGLVVTHLHEAEQYGTVDIDLQVSFDDDGACAGYCSFDWKTTDAGTLFTPLHPCDGGACFDQIPCPGESTDPFPVYPDDAGSFTFPYQYCANPGITPRTAHVVAHAHVTPP